jgi:hypothetical protein
MKLRYLALLLVFPCFTLPAQTRNDVFIYIPPCTGNNEADSRFFDESFAREIAQAGYTITQNETEAHYHIYMQMEDNIEYGEYEDSKLKILSIGLADPRNSREIISFAWEYDNPEEITEWMDMLYQSIPNVAASVPPSVSDTVSDTDRWRNKWFYALAYGGVDFTWFLSENIKGAEYTYTGPLLPDGRQKYINAGNNQGGVVRPLGGAGVEFQFLNFMSAETGIKLRFNNAEMNEDVPVLAFPLYIKFPLKPGKLFMLEPYAGIELNISAYPKKIKPAIISAAGGFQFGMWGGNLGAAFIDANISVDLGLSDVKGLYGEGKFQRIALGLSVGYKFGFFDRKPATAPQPADAGLYNDEYDDEYDYYENYEDYEDTYEDTVEGEEEEVN